MLTVPNEPINPVQHPAYGSEEWLRIVVRRVGIVAFVLTAETVALVLIGLHAWIGWPW